MDDVSVGGHRVMSRRIPEAHFLRYMNALASQDVTTALEELRRYFDFGSCKGGEVNAGLVGISTQVGDSLHAHYAILNLAVLHLHFGMAGRFCFKSAVPASVYLLFFFVLSVKKFYLYVCSFHVRIHNTYRSQCLYK